MCLPCSSLTPRCDGTSTHTAPRTQFHKLPPWHGLVTPAPQEEHSGHVTAHSPFATLLSQLSVSHPFLRQLLRCFWSFQTILHTLDFCTDGIIFYIFLFCSLSLTIIARRFLHVVPCVNGLFRFIRVVSLCTETPQFTSPTADNHLDINE